VVDQGQSLVLEFEESLHLSRLEAVPVFVRVGEQPVHCLFDGVGVTQVPLCTHHLRNGVLLGMALYEGLEPVGRQRVQFDAEQIVIVWTVPGVVLDVPFDFTPESVQQSGDQPLDLRLHPL